MKHFTSPDFWVCYRVLPEFVRNLADKNFKLLKNNPLHPSLHFKKIGKYRTVRVGLHYRAIAVEVSAGLLWFWIGTHGEYERMIKQMG